VAALARTDSHRFGILVPDSDQTKALRAGETDRRQRRHRAPARPNTELRHRWLVAQRRASGSGWCMHDGDHATLHDARTYVENVTLVADDSNEDPAIRDLVPKRPGFCWRREARG